MAEMPAPESTEESKVQVKPEAVSGARQTSTDVESDVRRVYEGRQAQMRAIFASQPRRTIRISPELWGAETFVGINGYKFQIKNGERVSVPEQVAQLLEDMGRI